jgi:hypothetical protein
MQCTWYKGVEAQCRFDGNSTLVTSFSVVEQAQIKAVSDGSTLKNRRNTRGTLAQSTTSAATYNQNLVGSDCITTKCSRDSDLHLLSKV